MGGVHVTHLKASAFAGQAAWAQGRNAALMGDFRQGVCLVHKLAQLRRTKELFQRSRNGLGVNQVVRHQRLLLGSAQTLFHGFFNPCQTCAELVFCQLAHAAHAAVAQVVNVIDFATAIAQLNQNFDHGQNVFVRKHHGAFRLFTANAGVKLHAPHAREVVAVGTVEQAVKQSLHRIFGRRLARAHHAVDGNAGSVIVSRIIQTQGLRNISALVELIGKQAGNFLHASFAQFFQQRFSQLIVGFGNNFARIFINDIAGNHAPEQEIFRHAHMGNASGIELANVLGCNALVFGNNNLAFFVGNVKTRNFSAQAVGNKSHLCACIHQAELVIDKEMLQNLLGIHANGFEQNRHGHLAAAVYAEIENVLWVKLKIQPGATVRNNAGAKQELAAGVRFAFVVLKKHARRAVQLRNNHALSAVNHKRAFIRHQRHFAHVNFLLFYFFYHFGLGSRSIAVMNNKLHASTHSRAKSQATGLALTHIKCGLGQVVFNKFHLDKTIVRNNGKCRFKRSLQPLGLAFFRGQISLQKGGVSITLHLQQIRNFQHAIAATKTFTDAFAFGIAVSHELSR